MKTICVMIMALVIMFAPFSGAQAHKGPIITIVTPGLETGSGGLEVLNDQMSNNAHLHSNTIDVVAPPKGVGPPKK